jgi:hypothetical protein
LHAVVGFEFGRERQMVAVLDNYGERGFQHGVMKSKPSLRAKRETWRAT